MENVLPRELIYRPKTGFGVPLRSWLGTTMRPLVEELLSPTVLSGRGLFNPPAIQRLKDDTLSGRRDGSYTLLGVMAMELWCRAFVDGKAP
jgi:asparagine synthase (glutamine-hydrolysing)